MQPNLSVAASILVDMRIRTLLGPPLPQEIVRDTATALALSMYTDSTPESDAEPAAARTHASLLRAALTRSEPATHSR